MTLFQTSKPKNEVLCKYIDYYYIDIKDQNVKAEFTCFPHYNTTLSLYTSHVFTRKGYITYSEGGVPLQIFTPMRDEALHVTQSGVVHRVVIVFKPLGIQSFFRNVSFASYLTNYTFFSDDELHALFSTIDINLIDEWLDHFLLARLNPYENRIVEQALDAIHNRAHDISIEQLSEHLKVSRRHLNRLFNSHFGLSVKKYHTIVVFRKSIESQLFSNPGEKLTSLAYQFNFSDQAHLIKTFRNLTHHSPKKFFGKGTRLGDADTFWHLET